MVSLTTPGRHRAARRLTAAHLTRGSAVLIATSGLVASMGAGAQASPAQPVTQPVSLPAAPTNVAAAPVTLPTHPSTPISGDTLRWGARGAEVKTVQRTAGAYADGIFGPETHAAVKRYQSDNGLVPDGIVGPLTSREMGLSSGGSASNASSGTTSTRESSSSSRSSGRSAPSTSSSSGSSASGVLGVAAQYTGIMYSWGGTSPSTGFDCSGYTQYVFAKVGISLPRTAEAQRRASTPVSNPRPGDLAFWGCSGMA